jgi:hypothetical protein
MLASLKYSERGSVHADPIFDCILGKDLAKYNPMTRCGSIAGDDTPCGSNQNFKI